MNQNYTLRYGPSQYGEPAILVNHGINGRWRFGLLVTQHTLSLLLPVTYQILLSMT